ncbi:MAG: hypothetical protein ACTSRW_12100 [Candidatus Helarchaeota archaeon]
MKRWCPFCESLSSKKVGQGYCERCRQDMSIFHCDKCGKTFYSCNHEHEKYVIWDSPSSKRSQEPSNSAGSFE